MQNIDSVLDASVVSGEGHPRALSGLFLFGVVYDMTSGSYVVGLPPHLLQGQIDPCLDAMLYGIPGV